MTPEHNETAVREQAYYLWEQDGKPFGRDNEYWMRAMVMVAERGQLETLTKAPPKAAKPRETVKIPKAAAAKATAPKAKAAPVKAGKSAAAKAKPKKK